MTSTLLPKVVTKNGFAGRQLPVDHVLNSAAQGLLRRWLTVVLLAVAGPATSSGRVGTVGRLTA